MAWPCTRLLALSLCFALVSFPPTTTACSVPPGGCTATKCAALAGLEKKVTGTSYTSYKAIGTYYGTWNSAQYPDQTAARSLPGGPWVGYEVYSAVESAYFLPNKEAETVTSLSACCSLCAKTANCTEYQFFEDGSYNKIKTGFGVSATSKPGGAYADGQQCYLLTGGSVTGTWPTPGPDNNGPYGTPLSGDHSKQVAAPLKNYPPSFVGGLCNPDASVVDDPHFVGAQGTSFDFNGGLGKTFVLLSDEGLNLNVKLDGYEDREVVGATKQKNGKAIRTWIKEIGLSWLSNGQRHTAVLVARKGKEQAVGDGFLAQVTVDGESITVPRAKNSGFKKSDLALTHIGLAKRGPYDVEMFQLEVSGKLEVVLQLRVAHRKLQTPDDAHVHFNIHIGSLKASDRVHGILGQTYRPTRGQQVKALKFSALASMLGKPIAADGESGSGFLDGSVSDYQTSGITAEDSKFSRPLTAA